MIKNLGKLNILPITANLSLVAGPTAELLKSIPNVDQEVGVAEIDANFSDTAAFCEHYEVSLGQTVNCVVVKATRGDKNWYAACMIFGNTRADVNGLIRRHLGARKASFAPMEEAVALTKMEYGGITAELNILYSLLRRTGTTKKTYASATEISALSSRLFAIDLEKNGGTSPSPSFKSVELFISTLSSGGYPAISVKPSDLPDWWRNSGNMDLFTSN